MTEAHQARILTKMLDLQMIEILNHTIDFLGPVLIISILYMICYLWGQNAITFSEFFFLAFWPGLVFKFRDYTRKKNGKVSNIYYLFFYCLIAVIVSVIVVTVKEMSKMPIYESIFVGLARSLGPL